MKRPNASVLGIGTGAIAVLAISTTLGVSAIAAHGATNPAHRQPASALSHSSAPGAIGQGVADQSGDAPASPVSDKPVSVPALHKLTPPDAVVRLSAAAAPQAIHRLRAMSGIDAVSVLDRGTVALRQQGKTFRIPVIGVPLGSIRGFTPQVTAVSNPLWQSIARGELTVGFNVAHRLGHKSLGTTLPVAGRASRGQAPGSSTGKLDRTSQIRIGAFATLGLPGVAGAVSHQAAAGLHLAPARMVLIHAPKISLDALHADISRSLRHVAKVTITRAQPIDQSKASPYALQTIPPSYLALYRRAAPTCPGLPWTVLAGIGTVETGNGTNVARSSAGALGPMQFMPATWKMYGVDADGDGKANIMDPVDAVFTAARYLCAAGASRGGQALNEAIFAYNHAWWYVREVVTLANEYA